MTNIIKKTIVRCIVLAVILWLGSYCFANPKEVKIAASNPVAIQASDTPIIDAFGRLRVSNPVTIFDSKNIFNDSDIADTAENQPNFYDNQETSGSGTSTAYDGHKSQQTISVSNATAGTRVRQTRQRFNYQPGKSLMVIMSFVPGSQDSGITKREGYFDENNGLYFEDDGTDYKFVRRTYTSGAAVNNEVTQDNWSIDKMDGSGPSKIDLDFTKTQLLFIDIEWLGVGRVRMGFVVDGLIYYAHEFLNTNVLDCVYIQTPNLPLRSEISNDGTGVTSNLIQICSTLISEGGQNDLGIVRSASTQGTHADVATENAVVPLLGIRLKSNYIGKSIDLVSAFAQIHTASDRLELFFLLNPTVTGTFTYVDETKSAVQIARWGAAHTVATGGIRVGIGGYVESGGVQAGSAGSGQANLSGLFRLGSLIDGTVDEIVLCCRPIGGSSDVDVEATLVWREM